ncbi:hypothetical protein BWQ96_01552 [Gracilariopsis chorda]|uniref:Uncharacterized protein n=1 Tax=Gracilariopsis chorda TaxID=448386 RepID=A0A2V3J5N8_9FLOR|nr:hypothetical protein BWQ96_01552 [Gracilariopsis chorda]|eukprot:PXF48700.1 hypothetical protein BWQ96_01552 [Gracilariopsis chorda]
MTDQPQIKIPRLNTPGKSTLNSLLTAPFSIPAAVFGATAVISYVMWVRRKTAIERSSDSSESQ